VRRVVVVVRKPWLLSVPLVVGLPGLTATPHVRASKLERTCHRKCDRQCEEQACCCQ